MHQSTDRQRQPLSVDAIAEDQRTRTFRLHIEEAAYWLDAGLRGDVPLGRAVMEADVTFTQAVRMLLDGPVDGWPPRPPPLPLGASRGKRA